MDKKLVKIKEEYEKLKKELAEPDIFKDRKKSARLAAKYGEIKEVAEKIIELESIEKNLGEAQDMLDTEKGELSVLAQEEVSSLTSQKKKIEKEIKKLLEEGKEKIPDNLIMEIRAGTGGEEAALFAADLFKMYSKFAENQNWSVKILNSNRTSIGGFKEIIFEINGPNAYKTLMQESGVHRVQRIPKTEKGGRIHTSTATVAVLPQVEKIDFEIKEEDLKVEVFRAGGPGGQHVNKVETAVRVTHLPTKITVSCQDEKSQSRNKEKALKILRSRLYQIMQEQEAEKRGKERRTQIGAAKRAEKVRTYNFPQDRLTDHRIKKSWHNLEGILAGNIEPIVSSLKNTKF